MVEILAAVTGASITAATMGIAAISSRSTAQRNQQIEARDAVLRLTLAVENVATRLEELHVDIKADRKETYQRLNGLEQRVAKLEAGHS